MLYVTATDINTYLDINLTGNGIALFNSLQQSMQDAVDLYCNRTWNFTNPVTEYFDAMNIVGASLIPQYTFFVKSPPISSTPFNSLYPQAGGINSLTIGSASVDMNYVFNYGSFVKLSASFPSVMLSNPLGFKAVTIVYNSDAAGNVPTPVKQALIEWIGRKIISAPDGGKETKEVMTGNIRAYFKEDKLGEMPDFVKWTLDKYRLAPIDHF